MKIEKKHIIIAIVVAVVAYFVWKRYKATTAEKGSAEVPTNENVDAILNAIGATSTEKAKILAIVKKIEGSLSWKAEVERKALKEGYTYAQQCVIDAIWSLYMKQEGETWVGKEDGDAVKCWSLINKVKAL